MAVIGKVGTYAQVQPLQGPDFGKMVKDQFDKMDADKKAAAEKKRKEAEAKAKSLEKLDFGVYEGGLPPALDEQLTNLTEAKRQEFYKYKEAGDIVNAEKVSNFIPKINALAKAAKEKTSKLEKDLSSGALYDKDYLSKTMEELNAYDKEDFILADKNGDVYITLLSEETDENGKRKILAPEQTVSSWLAKIDPPLAFDDQKALNRFKANNPVSKIETKSGMMFTTAEDVMKDPTVVQNINEYVSALSNSDSAMAKWYKDTKGEFKTRGFSKDEKEEFIKDNVDIYKNAYKESISLDLEQSTDEGLLQPKQPEVGLQEMEQGNTEQEVITNESEEKIRLQNAVAKASDKLSKAFDAYKNIGIVFDPEGNWKKDKELVKSLIDYAVSNIRLGAYNSSKLIDDLKAKGIEITKDAAEFIFDKASKSIPKMIDKTVGANKKSPSEQRRIDKAYGIGIATQKKAQSEAKAKEKQKEEVI